MRLFGPFSAAVLGEPLPRLRSQKGYRLLALLALRAGRPVQREWLAGTLWPESDGPDAAYSLRRSLADLRAAMGPAASRLTAPTPRSLQLELVPAECDILRFDRLATSVQASDLEIAAGLATGPLLEGWEDDWVAGERAVRSAELVRILQFLAAECRKASDLSGAVRWLRRLLAEEPGSEPAAMQLVEVLAAAGEPATALKEGDHFLAVLRDELGLEPGERFTALLAQLRELPGVRNSAPVPRKRPRGKRRGGTPPPRFPGEMVGRQRELREVWTSLRHSPLVMLTGPAGIGKTRLAAAVTAEWACTREYAVWWVSLAEATAEPARCTARVVAPHRDDADPVQILGDALHGERALLVLDNCEHMVEACAALALALLQQLPELHILCTSQEPLRVPGERIVLVPPLACPGPPAPRDDPDTLVARLQRSDAARLFLERASTGSPSFALNAENAAALTSICARLEGVPLALELAAGCIDAFSPAELATRLEHVLDLAGAQFRGTPERHRTLRAALDWSHSLLTASEQRLLRRLALFPAGATLEAAAAVAGGMDHAGEPVEAIVSSLVSRNLLRREQRNDGASRYRMLEAVREYALECLAASGEAPSARAALAAWAVRLAERLSPELREAGRGSVVDTLENEHANLETGLEALLAAGDAHLALRLVAALWRFWELRGYWRAGDALLRRTLALPSGPDTAVDRRLRAEVLRGVGSLARRRGELETARAAIQHAFELVRTGADRHAEVNLLHELALLDALGGNLAAAREGYHQALALARVHGDAVQLAALANDLGEVRRQAGDAAGARELFEECLRLARRRGDRRGMAAALANLGNLVAASGDTATARRMAGESLALLRAVGDRGGCALVLGNLAMAAMADGDRDAATAALRESLALRLELEEPAGLAAALEGWAALLASSGDHPRAARLLGVAAALREETGTPPDPDDAAAADRTAAATRAALGAAEYRAEYLLGRAADPESEAQRLLATA